MYKTTSLNVLQMYRLALLATSGFANEQNIFNVTFRFANKLHIYEIAYRFANKLCTFNKHGVTRRYLCYK